jgi:hypothetical protein
MTSSPQAPARPPRTDVDLASLTPDSAGVYDVAGVPIAMPVEIRRARMASAGFVVPFDAAAALIQDTGLTPARTFGRALSRAMPPVMNRAMVSLAMVRYLDGDLGTYDELALAVVVDPPAGEPPATAASPATYIHRLPVSGEFTTEAGRGIWGFPKWVADLRVDVVGGVATADLRNADGSSCVSVAIRRGRLRVPARPLDMRCYSTAADGGLVRTAWTTRPGSLRMSVGSGCWLRIGDGHPFADELRLLRLPSRPLMTMFTETLTASFGTPERL